MVQIVIGAVVTLKRAGIVPTHWPPAYSSVYAGVRYAGIDAGIGRGPMCWDKYGGIQMAGQCKEIGETDARIGRTKVRTETAIKSQIYY